MQMTEKFPLHQSLHTPIAGKPMAHAIGFPAIQFPQRRMSAAALSAAVDSTHKQEPASPRMGAQVRRNVQVYSHPLFGRGGSGGRGASLREAASPPSVPPPEFFLCISLYFSWFLLDGMGGTWYDAKQFHRRDESPPRKAMKSSSSRGASLAESREKVQVRQGEPVKEQLGASARKAQAK